ncbi:MAG: nucleotide exchange factor GrpE [Christensenellales bacterium]|nr:nucleotide exchange factor GrpE [Christensenellales bacterium]
MNRKKDKRGEENGTLRQKLRKAAEGMKEKSERAKNMSEETRMEQEAAQEAQNTELDAAALAAELEKTKAQCDEYLDLAQRKQAEFANYRRRTEGVRQEAFDDGRRDAIDKLLPVIDNIERALSAAGDEESGLKTGVEMVLRQTKETFAKMGVEEIDPLGQPFDAELHNAVMQGGAEEGEPGTVCMVLQKGYRLGGRVIRHAMVKVVAG